MKKMLFIAVSAALATACTEKKTEAPKPAPPPPAEVKAAPPPAPAAAPAAEEKPVVVDDALVDKYLTAQKTIVAETKTYVQKTAEDLKAAKDSTLGSLDALKNVEARAKALDETKRTTLEKVGLSRKEYDVANDLVLEVELSRTMYENAGGDAAVAKMEDDLKKQLGPALAQMPPAERAKAEKDSMQITQSLRDMGSAKDARAKHGDAAVDAVLKRLPEAKALREELMGLMKKQ